MKEHRVLESSSIEISTVLTQALPQGSTIDIVLNIEVLDFRPSPTTNKPGECDKSLSFSESELLYQQGGEMCMCVCVFYFY